VGAPLELWTSKWPHHVFILLVVAGEVEATLPPESLLLLPFSQLVVLPGTPCTLHARTPSTIEVISFRSSPPAA
jgi:hypothetical protein